MTSGYCDAKRPGAEERHTIRALAWALSISIVGHILVANTWKTATPSRPSPPVQVRLAHRAVDKPLSESSTSYQRRPEDAEHSTQKSGIPTPSASRNEEPFLPPSSLDQAALPKSGPSLESLDDIPTTGMPIRLRLYIDETGVVQQVVPLEFAPDDEAAVFQLQRVFMDTTFLPGQRQGKYVRSYLDIEITPNPLN